MPRPTTPPIRLTQTTDATGDYTNYRLDALGEVTATQVYIRGVLTAQHPARSTRSAANRPTSAGADAPLTA